MKKALSFITAFAMLFALVIPVTAAEEISLFSAGADSVAVSYKAFVGSEQVTEVRPGDTVTITAYAKMTSTATDFNLVTVPTKYDAEKLEPISGDEGASENSSKSIIEYSFDGGYTSTKSVDVTETSIFSYNFKVKDTAAGTTTIDKAVGIYEVDFEVYGADNGSNTRYDELENNLNVTPLTLTITANEAKAYIGDNTEIENGRTYFAGSVTVTAYATNPVSAKIYKGETEIADLYNAETGAWSSVTLSGTDSSQGYGDYKVVVKAAGVEKTYTFALHTPVQAQIDNKISTDISKGVNRNGEITIPVKIDGLGSDVKAAMVSFAIGYDTDVFEMTSFDNKAGKVVYSSEDNKFVYGSENTAEEDALANEEEITSIVLKVKNGAKFGNTDVEFSHPDIALYAAAAPSKQEVSDQTLAIKYLKQTVTIVPTATEAATFGNIPNGWAATKDIAVTPADGVALVYGSNDSDLAENADLAALFTAGTNVTDKLTADTEDYYYVIAKVGGETDDAPVVYVLVKTYTPSDLQIDKTAPTVSFSDVPTDWVKELTITSDNIIAADARGEVAKTEYFVGEVTNDSEWSVLTGAGITMSDGTSVVTVRATDTAGNVSASAAVTVKVDGVAPTVSAEAQSANNDNKVPVKVTASDATSGLKVESDSKVYAAVYFDGKEGAAAKTELTASDKAALTSKGNIELTEGVGEYIAGESGIYYFVVSDNASNESFASATVKITTLPEAKDLLVKTVKTDAGNFHAGFIPNGGAFVAKDREGNSIEHNGWFTYVKAVADTAPTGYTNTIKYTLDGGAPVDFTANELANGKEFTTPGQYVVTVTTTRDGVAADTKSKDYTFFIVGVGAVKSTTARNFYSMLDYARIKRLVLLNKTAADEYAEFWGGMFSGDLDGNLLIEAADLQPILDSLANGEDIGTQYSIPIMNLDAPAAGE